MKKIFVLICAAICFFIVLVANGTEPFKLNGSWECKPYLKNQGEVRGSVNGNVHFLTSNKFVTNHNYHFFFEEMGELNLHLKLTGTWKVKKNGFVSNFEKVEVKIIDNSTPLSDDDAKKNMNDHYVLFEDELHKVEFTSKDFFIWSDVNGADKVNCSKM